MRRLFLQRNKKSQAWDVIGMDFFEIGHIPIRENKHLIGRFLEDIPAGSRCCILGASTLNLIKDTIKAGFHPTILDFSPKMCKGLAKRLRRRKKYHNHHTIQLCDVTSADEVCLQKKYDYIFADQIINCFNEQELHRFLQNVSKMLAPNGELRTVVKIGLYDVDKKIIAKGRERQTVNIFFDEEALLIDYSKAFGELQAIFPKRFIRPNRLCSYYCKKGEEKRFTDTDIQDSVLNVEIENGAFKIIESVRLNSREESIFYKIKWLL